MQKKQVLLLHKQELQSEIGKYDTTHQNTDRKVLQKNYLDDMIL